MTEVDYRAMYKKLDRQHLEDTVRRDEANHELSRRIDHVHITGLVLMIAAFCALACSIFFDWSWWISVAFMWSGWSCITAVDYVKGAVTRTVFI